MDDDLREKLLAGIDQCTREPALRERAGGMIEALILKLRNTPGVTAPEIEETVLESLGAILTWVDNALSQAETRLGLARGRGV